MYLSKKINTFEKVLFEYIKNNITSYETLKNADLPSGMIYIINKYQLE